MPAIQEQADDQPAIPEAVFVVAVMYGVTDAFVRIDLHWNIAALVPLGLLIVGSAGLAMVIAGLTLVWKRIPLLNDLALTLVMFVSGALPTGRRTAGLGHGPRQTAVPHPHHRRGDLGVAYTRSAVGQRLAAEDLGGVLNGLRDALRLPYAALDAGPQRIVTSGEPTGTQHVVPLMHRGERIGQLVTGARWGERRLPAAERAVLELLANPLAIALHATMLSEQLQASRARLVTATAEERRRLHRELHDSLGPVLTGAALKADSTALAARSDGIRAERLATELAGQLRQAIADVRRLVYGLRPPALDELGLVAALRRQQGQLGDLALTVDAPDVLPELPAAIEVAAYRIATEALTNVVRHAGAQKAVLSLHTDGTQLRVSVTDDGGSAGSWTPGVGLQSIRERVAEVGGHCEAGPTGHGGRVLAVLPLGGVP